MIVHKRRAMSRFRIVIYVFAVSIGMGLMYFFAGILDMESPVGGHRRPRVEAISADDAHDAGDTKPRAADPPMPYYSRDSTTLIPASDSAGHAVDGKKPLVLFGTVSNSLGGAVSSPDTRLSADTGSNIPIVTTVDGLGRYVFPVLEAGRYHLEVSSPGYRPYEETLDIPRDGLGSPHDVILFPLTRIRICALAEAGKPLMLALQGDERLQPLAHRLCMSAVATKDAPPLELPRLSERRYHRFGLGSFVEGATAQASSADGYLGSLDVFDDGPFYVSLVLRNFVLSTQRLASVQDSVTFVVPVMDVLSLLANVTVQLADDISGLPIPGASVELNDSQTFGAEGSSDAAGTCKLSYQLPGWTRIDVRGPSYERVSKYVLIPSGRSESFDIRMSKVCSISGTVTNGEHPVAGLLIHAVPINEMESSALCFEPWSAVSDSTGKFSITDVGRRLYSVMAMSPEQVAVPNLMDCRGGSLDGVTVVVVAGIQLRVHVVAAGDSEYGLALKDENGGLVAMVERLHGSYVWAARVSGGNARLEVRLGGALSCESDVVLSDVSKGADIDVSIGTDGAHVTARS